MVGEEFGHLGGHLADHRIFFGGRERGNFGFFFRELAECPAILIVEVPVPALRLALGGHEDISFGAKTAVVGFHEQVFLSLGPGGEVGPRDDKLG